MIHEVKIRQEYYKNLLSENKKSEIRLNDRDYQVDDILSFYLVNHKGEIISDLKDEHQFIITHIHSGLGMRDGYVVLSLQKFKKG